MSFLRNLPIQRKVMLVVMLTASVALLLAGAALLSYEFRDFRQKNEDVLSTLARVIGASGVAAVSFDDADAAAEMLAALKGEPQVVAAAIYRRDGAPLASYLRAGSTVELPRRPLADGFTVEGHRLRHFAPIEDETERARIGTIFFEADIGAIGERVKSYAGLLGLVLLASALVALALSAALQRYISQPIRDLAATAQLVSGERDYSVRVPRRSSDELGQLIGAFNEMLAQIQSRDAALQAAHDQLDQRVRERTAELAHSLSVTHATLESTADGILVVSTEGKVVGYNQKFLQMWRIPDERASTHDDPALISSVLDQLKDPAAFEKRIAQLYFDPAATSHDLIEFLDGRIFERYSQPQHVDGRFVGRVWSFRDITERSRAEERIREQASLLDLAQDSITVRDLDGDILFWNKGAERVFGWKAEEVAGRNLADILRPDAERLREAEAAVRASGSWMGDLSKHARDGREVITESRWTLLRDAAGAPKSVLVIDTDVTERKKLEGQFLRAQRMESIGTLAGGIAHDLNNVLAPILMSTDLLLSQIDDPEIVPILQTMDTSAQRGADLVQQILMFARGAEGKRAIVHPERIVTEIYKIARDTFPKDIEVASNVAEGLWPVLGDATQLHQVLLNLCVNARDAMPGGGRLAIDAENFQSDGGVEALRIAPAAGPNVLIRVCDSGGGIPRELRDKIFEPFFTTKEVGKGTGLGLSTALAIIKGHGGTLDLESEQGRGTTFTICLPAAPAAAEETGPEAAVQPAGRRELVLVVDDEESIRFVTKQTLENFGYRVLIAADGQAALSLYRERSREIALVLTDMMMPGADGAATIRGLKQIDPNVRVIAASGLMTDERTLAAADAGAVAFLRKPYSAQVLLRTLRQVLTGTASDIN